VSLFPRQIRSPLDVVHRENKWKLLRLRGPRKGPPVLLVPSLINRWYVLDLLPGKSFAASLVERGLDVFVVDWGTPADEDRFLTFDDVCDRYLGRAVRRASALSAGQPVHLLGYCMGGTLTAIHAAVRPERVASLCLVAAPIRFAEGGILTDWSRTPSFDPGLLASLGNVPWPLLQATFHMLRPTLLLSKVVNLLPRLGDREFVRGVLALEGWGNDNVSFPAEVFRAWIGDLYQRDQLFHGEFALSGQAVRLEAIRCPTMVVTFEQDHIVPKASATAILDKIPPRLVTHIHYPGGHVGAMTSRAAATGLWPELGGWLAQGAPIVPSIRPSGASVPVLSA